MSERYVVNCEGSERQPRCAYTRAVSSALQARVMAEGHGSRLGHSVRVYMSQTVQIGFWDPHEERYEIVAFIGGGQAARPGNAARR